MLQKIKDFNKYKIAVNQFQDELKQTKKLLSSELDYSNKLEATVDYMNNELNKRNGIIKAQNLKPIKSSAYVVILVLVVILSLKLIYEFV